MSEVPGNGDYRDLIFGWTIIPENSIGSRSALLGVRFKYFFTMRTFETREFMCLQAIVPGIGCQQSDGFLYRHLAFSQRWIGFDPIIIRLALAGPENFEQPGAL